MKSEQIVVSAPMSFDGSTRRLWKLTENEPKWLWVPMVVVAIGTAWCAIVLWYMAFGLMLVPYRLLRRGSRKRKVEAERHREMMQAIERAK